MSGRSRESVKRELTIRYRNLDTLEERRAKFGISAPIELINQIHDEREAIGQLEALLARLESSTLGPTEPRRRDVSVQTLEDRDWDSLLRRIKEGNCTPFIGSEVVKEFVPTSQEIAREWAEEHGYPLTDPWNMARVAQFLAIKRDPIFPGEDLARRLRQLQVRPDFRDAAEAHSFLAGLPLPIYITTNYDDFIVQALNYRLRPAQREICRWNRHIRDLPSIFEPGSTVEISAASPVVYHLFGHAQLPESLVLTEDDYMDFLVNVAQQRQDIIPRRIEKALVNTSLLFIGYELSSLEFRAMFRGLITSLERSLRRTRLAVQLTPAALDKEGVTTDEVRWYLEDYFAKDDLRIYWGTAGDFIAELKERWESFNE